MRAVKFGLSSLAGLFDAVRKWFAQPARTDAAGRDKHSEAEAVRALALAQEDADPAFARELYAVAYRHEQAA